MTPIELTQKMLGLATAMDALAAELESHHGYETRILRHQLAQGASALRSKQIVVAAEIEKLAELERGRP